MSALVFLALLELAKGEHVPRWVVWAMGFAVVVEALTAVVGFANKILDRRLAKVRDEHDKIVREAIEKAVAEARSKMARAMGARPS